MTNIEPQKSRLAASFLPATAVLEMTYACNHACLFCSCPWYDNRGGFDIRPELGVEQWKSLISKLCSMGVGDLAFTGGEPLLKEGVEEIIRFAASCQVEHVETKNEALVSRFGPPRLYLLSNGKIMSEEVLALCQRHQVHLGLSLPGLMSFAEHTVKSQPGPILHWFKRAKDMGLSTHVGITVTRKNLDELYETMAQALLAGADSVLLNRFMPGGRGLRYAQELLLNREQTQQMLAVAEEVLRLANRFGNVGTELPKCIIDPRLHTHLTVGSQCSAVLGFFVIDPSGYIRVCNHSPVRLHHVNEIEHVLDHPYWKRFVLKDYLPSACAGCAQAGRCDGGCREAAHIWQGALDAVDPILCEQDCRAFAAR